MGESVIDPDKLQDIVKEIESIIDKVQGVVSGKVICQNGDIAEVHVLSNGKRSPKQIVRDIESAVLIKTGSELDHKKISVAQLCPKINAPATNNTRFIFKRIRYSSDIKNIAVEITIDAKDHSYTSVSSGPNMKSKRLDIAVAATLAAINKFIKPNGVLTIAEIKKVYIGGQYAVTVAVCLRSNNKEDILLGTAFIKGDDLETAVRATLDAINRRTTVLQGS